MIHGADQNQTRLSVAPCAPQFSASGVATPGIVTAAVSTFADDSTSFFVVSAPQTRKTSCSPRLYTVVWAQPISRGAAPTGRVPLTVSTESETGSFAAAVSVPAGVPPPSWFGAVVEIVSCDDATGSCTY